MEGKGDNACVKSLGPLPDDGVYGYIAVKGSLHAQDCCAFGLEPEEIKALSKKFPGSGVGVVNGVTIKTNAIAAINVLSQLGYKIVSSTGEAEITWTLQRELEHGTEHHVCKCTASGVTQTLDEMDWERGIWYAALLGDKARVMELLQRDGAARATDNSGYTALHYAARSGHTHICKSLLEHGAFIDAQTKSGKSTSLHRAAAAGNLQTVKFLLSRGACPETIDADGQTALHRAAQFNHLDIISTLLESCPLIEDVKDSKGRTAHDLLSALDSRL